MTGKAMESEKIRILIVEGTRMASRLLADALGQQASLEIVSATSSGQEALRAVNELHPQVVLISDMLGTLDRHLGSNEYVAGDYSIADMTMYPDVHLHGVKDIGLGEYPNLKRWHDAIEARPAIKRAWGPFPS